MKALGDNNVLKALGLVDFNSSVFNGDDLLLDVETWYWHTPSWILKQEGVSAKSFAFLLENNKEEEDKIRFYKNKFIKLTISN